MRRVTINVTQQDIEQGEPELSRACPVARAIGRRIRGELFITSVSSGEIEIIERRLRAAARDDLLIVRRKTPRRARRFIQVFDEMVHDHYSPSLLAERDEVIRPFRFDIRLPEEVLA